MLSTDVGQKVFEPFVSMAKYNAHAGMVNPVGSLSIEINDETMRKIHNKYGGYRYRVNHSPDRSCIRIFPEVGGRSTFGVRAGGKCHLRIVDASNKWLENVPPFASTRCEMVFYEKYFDVKIPEIRKPPTKKNRSGNLNTPIGGLVLAADYNRDKDDEQFGEAEDTPDYASYSTPKPEEPVKSVTLFDCIDMINEFKKKHGDAMLLSINKDGFLKAMVDYGSD